MYSKKKSRTEILEEQLTYRRENMGHTAVSATQASAIFLVNLLILMRSK